MLNAGWRMRENKPGLADLKRLRQQALKDAQPDPPSPRTTARKKQRKFAAPGRAPISEPPSTQATEARTAPTVAESDKALFRRVMQSVHRLPEANRAILPPVPLAPKSVLQQKRIAASGKDPDQLSTVSDVYAPPDITADPTRYVREGHGPDLVKHLTKGKWPIEATLDLHGTTLDEARPRLDRFLRSCLEHKIKCVRIVHGKGHGSKGNTPVLKDTVRRWLTQIENVKAFAECEERDGGAGAVLALLQVKHD